MSTTTTNQPRQQDFQGVIAPFTFHLRTIVLHSARLCRHRSRGLIVILHRSSGLVYILFTMRSHQRILRPPPPIHLQCGSFYQLTPLLLSFVACTWEYLLLWLLVDGCCWLPYGFANSQKEREYIIRRQHHLYLHDIDRPTMIYIHHRTFGTRNNRFQIIFGWMADVVEDGDTIYYQPRPSWQHKPLTGTEITTLSGAAACLCTSQDELMLTLCCIVRGYYALLSWCDKWGTHSGGLRRGEATENKYILGPNIKNT